MASKESRPRPMLVTLVLAGILLVMVGAAWAMVRYYRTSAREGALLLEEMRKRTLEEFWSSEPYQAEYEWRDSRGQAIHRQSIVRRPVEGGFAGTTRSRRLAGRLAGREVLETWKVRGDLAEAEYLCKDGIEDYTTWIRLEAGRLHYQSSGGPEIVAATQANYIPEGLEWLAVRVAARSGRKATFMLLSNEASHEAGGIAYGRVTVTPLGGQSVRCLYVWPGNLGSHTWTYRLDDAGEIVHGQSDGGMVFTRLESGTGGTEGQGPRRPARGRRIPALARARGITSPGEGSAPASPPHGG